VEARLTELTQQKESDLATLLSPEELTNLKLRTSPAALYVMANLPEAESEAEFALMVQAVEEVEVYSPRGSFQRRYGLPLFLFGPEKAAEDQKETDNTNSRIHARLEELLGKDRLAELERRELAAATRSEGAQ
jgi:hypothetical protein